jgi:signal transduction histidine kinase
VRDQPTAIHAIVVAVPGDTRREVFRDLAGRLLFAGTVGAGAAAVAALLLWASLYRPLGRVTRGVRAVAAGDFGQRVPEQGPAEVRALAADVNRMADAVQSSRDTLREFLANVSHEVRTPLTSIRGFSQAMLDGTLDTPEELARAARVIDAESRRVLQLVGELLDLSRIESGQQRMELAPVRASELLAQVRDVFSMRAAETGVTLDVRVPSTDVTVAADFDRIEQVLGNLIDNALRHTPRGGRIDTGVRTGRSGLAEFYVADNGEGIAEADLPHVFDRFYRSALGEPEMPGAGLGLAISREIVRAHGGTIAASRREGGGTEFSFTLRVNEVRE